VTVTARPGSSGPLWQRTNGDSVPAKPAPSTRKISTEVISGFRCTTVIDTPMRKLEVLESISDGNVMVRDTEFYRAKAHVALIHLEYEQVQTLAAVLKALDEAPSSGNGKTATA
jgi:hypothetical protein